MVARNAINQTTLVATYFSLEQSEAEPTFFKTTQEALMRTIKTFPHSTRQTRQNNGLASRSPSGHQTVCQAIPQAS